MYFIAKGEAAVNILNDNKKIKNSRRILKVNEYFGEISMVYGCKRTAEVISTKYTTLAKLSK
jgi:hypothetical protein